MNNRIPLEDIRPQHFGWTVEDRVATVTINRPQVLNALKADGQLRHIPVVIISMIDNRDLGMALVGMHLPFHVVHVGDGGKVQVPPPNERRNLAEQTLR